MIACDIDDYRYLRNDGAREEAFHPHESCTVARALSFELKKIPENTVGFEFVAQIFDAQETSGKRYTH
jgi:hypothetical protein